MKQTQPIPASSRRSLVLTGEGGMWVWVAILLTALGWYKSINLVLLLAYAMFALLVLNAILARRHARRVGVVRELSPPVFAGEASSVRLTATNTGTRSATVTVADRTGDAPMSWLIH